MRRRWLRRPWWSCEMSWRLWKKMLLPSLPWEQCLLQGKEHTNPAKCHSLFVQRQSWASCTPTQAGCGRWGAFCQIHCLQHLSVICSIDKENTRDVVCCYKTRSFCGNIYLIRMQDYPWFFKPLTLRRNEVSQCKMSVNYSMKMWLWLTCSDPEKSKSVANI